MDKKRLLIGIVTGIIFLAIAIFGSTGKIGNKSSSIGTNKDKYTATFLDVFDTRTELVGYASSQSEFEETAGLIKAKLVYYNQLYDIYNDYEGINNIKTINDNAGVTPIVVDQDIIDLIKYSKEMYYTTNGKTNVAMGSVLKIWHNYRERGINNPEEASLPDMSELEEANKHTDIEKIIIDEEKSTIYLEDKDMSLDVGSIGKGYAVERVAEYAKELGNDNMLISVGGNICALGTHSDGTQWKLGIQNPDLSSDVSSIEKVYLKDRECVVSSGNYQRYYEVDGKRYCHIINPDTLFPADYFAAVSVITKDSGKADALSTALFNMTIEEGLEYVNNSEGVEAMWITDEGELIYSNNFSESLVR